VLDQFEKDHQLLGELQYAFVTFLLGQVYNSFEQWKSIVALLCNCEEALLSHPRLFLEFLGVLHFQIKETPDDFFTDIESGKNTLAPVMRNLFINLRTTKGVVPQVQELGEELERMLRNRFEFINLDDEDDEDAPLIVQEEQDNMVEE